MRLSNCSKLTTKYRLFTVGNEYYQGAEILAVKPISAPLPLDLDDEVELVQN